MAEAGRRHADRRADEDPCASRVRPVDAGIGPRFACGGNREHHVPLESPRLLRPDHRLGVESLYLRRDPNGVSSGVERRDEVDTASSGDRRIPRRLRVEPERSDGSQTGDGNATHETESVVA